jgi:hypothetical protein
VLVDRVQDLGGTVSRLWQRGCLASALVVDVHVDVTLALGVQGAFGVSVRALGWCDLASIMRRRYDGSHEGCQCIGLVLRESARVQKVGASSEY